MPDSTTYQTHCIRIERTDGFVICLTSFDKNIIINDGLLGLGSDNQAYLSAAGYTPTNTQSTSDNSVNNADVEGVLTSLGVSREDIIGGRYDFSKIHMFIWDWKNDLLIKKLGSGHWGEVTLKDGSYVAEFRSLSQQLQQRIGRTYNPECDEQLGGPRCTIALGVFPFLGSVTAETSKSLLYDTSLNEIDNYWDGTSLLWTSGLNDTIVSLVETYTLSTKELILNPELDNYIAKGDTYTLSKIDIEDQAVTSVTSTSIFSDSTRTEADSYFTGMTLEFTTGVNTGHTSIISNFVSNEFTIATPTPLAISITDEYKVTNIHLGTASVGVSYNRIEDSTLGAIDYTGMLLQFTSGDNDGDHRTIDSYGSGFLTVSSDFSNPILKSDKYTVINDSGVTYMALGEVTGTPTKGEFTATITNDGTFGDDYFNYGKLQFFSGLNDSLHMEVKDFDEATNTFTLFLPMPFDVQVGDDFRVFAGCDKRLDTCKTKFNNLVNFQGFPYIPGIDQISRFGGQ